MRQLSLWPTHSPQLVQRQRLRLKHSLLLVQRLRLKRSLLLVRRLRLKRSPLLVRRLRLKHSLLSIRQLLFVRSRRNQPIRLGDKEQVLQCRLTETN